MSASTPTGPRETRLLPDNSAGGTAVPVVASTSPSPAAERVQGASPPRQLSELPRDELNHLADEFGLDPTKFKEAPALVAAIHDRRQMIAGMERDALLDVVRWGRRPVAVNATREQLAMEAVRIKSMRFAGLSQRGLLCLAKLRGVACEDADDVPKLVKKLKKSEGFFASLNRKRRSFVASVVANMVGEVDGPTDYRYLPSPDGKTAVASGPPEASLKHEIEEAGLFGGISNRLKKSADGYINQKLDEIEARIDRKLDEIDRRLAEWRDKEVANRIKILKITLWASVIVGVVSLIYSYVMMVGRNPAAAGGERKSVPTQVAPAQVAPAPAAPAPTPSTAPTTSPTTTPAP